MYPFKELSRVYNSAERILFDDSTRIAVISDCHRGDGSWADNFIKNRNAYRAALAHYFKNGYIYMELGDGDELWAKTPFSGIVDAHRDVFEMLKEFYEHNRLYLFYGNHDIDKRSARFIRKCAAQMSVRDRQFGLLLLNIRFHEGLILKHTGTGGKILLLHGHQADFFNDRLWKLSRFLVRYLWKPLESVGIRDPTSASKNFAKTQIVEKSLAAWAENERLMLITGHTHRSVFPKAGEAPYFNDGCCVNPYGITAIEIEAGRISLVKWSVKTRDDAALYVCREVLEGPARLSGYFSREGAARGRNIQRR